MAHRRHVHGISPEQFTADVPGACTQVLIRTGHRNMPCERFRNEIIE